MLRIEKERRRRGLTKAALAREAGMNASTVQLIIAGRFKPYDGQRQRLAVCLGIDPATLCDEVADHAEA